MAFIEAEIRGVDITVTGLENATNGVMKAAFLGVLNAIVKAEKDSREMISASDHSLQQLAKMGHPYGFKHPAQIHDPDEIIHIQSGRYEKALKAQKPRSYADREIIEGRVGIMGDAAMETLDQRLQLGTSKMRARNWSQYVVDHHGEEYGQIVEDAIAAKMEEEGA
jgi:hypothetical protein